jgi:hypothetical protein
MLWCWRCKMEMPMLDEIEYARVHEVIRNSTGPMSERSIPACKMYEEITGFYESNVNAIKHHRISLYGPPCKNCGKPLRTSQAAFCAACGHILDSPTTQL